jgi:uncharacterized protein
VYALLGTIGHWLGVGALLLTCVVGVFSLVVGFPGTWMILAGSAVYAVATEFARISFQDLLWLAGLAGVGEVLEFWASIQGGPEASRRARLAAVLGAICGGLLGAPLLFGLGALPGAFGGAFLGAAAVAAFEGGTMAGALRVGLAAMKGRALGFLCKGAIAVAMVVLVLRSLW